MIRGFAAALLVATAAPVTAQTIAITGGTVALGDGKDTLYVDFSASIQDIGHTGTNFGDAPFAGDLATGYSGRAG